MKQMKKGTEIERIRVMEKAGIIEDYMEEIHIAKILNPTKVMKKKKNQVVKKLDIAPKIGKRIVTKDKVRDMINPMYGVLNVKDMALMLVNAN